MIGDQRHVDGKTLPPLLAHKYYDAPSVFLPENLLREARRQKGLPSDRVPAVCVLDPDGDLVDTLYNTGRSNFSPTWACYHTKMAVFTHREIEYGIIGRAVGAPFAVLVAEELFASGCELLISITSAGQITAVDTPPYTVLIERALRDEGTSYHYLPPAPYSHLHPALREAVAAAWDHSEAPLHVGASWTTDAPFRETEAALCMCREQGIWCVEMETAALYALSEAKNYPIVCFAYVTNEMAQDGSDFEKGEGQGSAAALKIIDQAARGWMRWRARHL